MDTTETGPLAAIRAAERVLDKVRLFADGLDPEERELFAALVGPGVALAHLGATPSGVDPAGVDLAGAGTWAPRQLPAHLAAAIRNSDVDLTEAPPH